MPPVGFEPTISAGERPKTYALDRVFTGTGVANIDFRYRTEWPSQADSHTPCNHLHWKDFLYGDACYLYVKWPGVWMPAILLYGQKIYTSHLSKNCRKCPIFTSLSILSSHLRLFLHSFQSYEKQILASLLLYTHIHIHKNTHAYISLIHHCSINVWICRISGNTRIGCSTQNLVK